MNATRKVKLKDITPNLTCNLCKGYFIDATTIIECLHSFCKSCIVKHLEKSEYCPVCDVQLHSTKPLSSIRSDQMLQEIVYKLVPGLFRKEMDLRRDFYKIHPECSPTSQMDSGQVFNELYITSDDIIHISLEYFTNDFSFKENTKRFLKCPAAVSIVVLKKLLQGKFDLRNDAQVDIMYGERVLPDDFLLMDVAYKYSWTSNGTKPLQLSYRVKGMSPPEMLSSVKRKVTKTPNVLTKRRRSRASLDTETQIVAEILKNSNRNSLIDHHAQRQNSNTPKLTPNGKVRGRKKRSITVDGVITPIQNAKVKVEKAPAVKNYKEMECQSDTSIMKMPMNTEKDKEVQLRISENGIISARNISSGEEKVIGNLGKSPENGMKKNSTEHKSIGTTTLNGFTPTKSTPGPSGGLVHPLLMSNGGSVSSHNYVKLNIPSLTLNGPSVSKPLVNGNMDMNSVHQNILNSNINGTSSQTPASSAKIPNNPGQKGKRKNSDKTQQKSPKRNIGTKSSNPSEEDFEDKRANVKKALIDLEKKLSTGLPHGLANGNNNNKISSMGLSSNNIYSHDTNNGSCSSGQRHLETNNNNISTTSAFQPYLNGQNSLSFPLSFGSSGMTVNLIPSTSTGSSSTSPQQKRITHQTTLINGDMRFTSPRHILPSPCKDVSPPVSGSMSPKKPPKFFKSRHSSTIPGSSSESESPNKKEKEVQQLKNANLNGNSSHVNFSHGTNSTIMTKASSANGANTTTTPSGISSSQSQAFRQLSNVFNPLAYGMNMNPLQMSLAAAAAASSNNLPMTLVPFVTNNYCSMPFLNTRSPFNMNLPYPFSFPGMANPNYSHVNSPSTSYSIASSEKNGVQQTTSTSLSKPSPTSYEGDKNFLDLSINKNKKKRLNESIPCQEEPLSLKKLKPSSSSPIPDLIKPDDSTNFPNGLSLIITKDNPVNSPLSESFPPSESTDSGNEIATVDTDCSEGKPIIISPATSISGDGVNDLKDSSTDHPAIKNSGEKVSSQPYKSPEKLTNVESSNDGNSSIKNNEITKNISTIKANPQEIDKPNLGEGESSEKKNITFSNSNDPLLSTSLDNSDKLTNNHDSSSKEEVIKTEVVNDEKGKLVEKEENSIELSNLNEISVDTKLKDESKILLPFNNNNKSSAEENNVNSTNSSTTGA